MTCTRLLTAALTAVALVLSGGCSTPAPETTQGPQGANQVMQAEYERALWALKAERNDEATELLMEFVEKYPGHAGPWANLGILYTRTGKADEAVAALENAIALNPNNAQIHNQLGVAYRQQGKFDDALHAYNEALKLNPDHPPAHLNIGILYDIYLSEPERALGHYRRYQALSQNEDENVKRWIVELERRI
jgi:Flp pilus assembly protein TadD